MDWQYGAEVFVWAITTQSMEEDAALSASFEKAADEILAYLTGNSPTST